VHFLVTDPSDDAIFGQGFRFGCLSGSKAVNGMDKADGPEIIEFDLRTAQMRASRKKLNLPDVRKDQPMAKAYGYHGEILPGQTEPVYAAPPFGGFGLRRAVEPEAHQRFWRCKEGCWHSRCDRTSERS
jgi:hypothetical protein